MWTRRITDKEGFIEKKGGIRPKKQAHHKWLCCHCLKTGKGNGTCGTEGHLRISVSHKLWFPKVTASKSRWKKMLLKDSWAGRNLEARSGGEAPEYYTVLMKTINSK